MDLESQIKMFEQKPLDLETESFLFLKLFEHDLQDAVSTLGMIRRYSEENLINILIRDVVISYAKPFSSNYGKVKKIHKLRKDEIVPSDMIELHETLIKFRDKVFAHTDIETKNPRLSKFGMTFMRTRYEELKPKVGEIEKLIEGAQANLSRKIKAIWDLEFSEETD
jgi:hypothetical protein